MGTPLRPFKFRIWQEFWAINSLKNLDFNFKSLYFPDLCHTESAWLTGMASHLGEGTESSAGMPLGRIFPQ